MNSGDPITLAFGEQRTMDSSSAIIPQDEEATDQPVSYKRPPVHSRFKPGGCSC